MLKYNYLFDFLLMLLAIRFGVACKVDNAMVHRKNRYPVDSVVCFVNTGWIAIFRWIAFSNNWGLIVTQLCVWQTRPSGTILTDLIFQYQWCELK